MREAILAVSFGTTVDQARSRDLEGVEQALSAAAPELPLFRAYTSGLVRARLGDRGSRPGCGRCPGADGGGGDRVPPDRATICSGRGI